MVISVHSLRNQTGAGYRDINISFICRVGVLVGAMVTSIVLN